MPLKHRAELALLLRRIHWGWSILSMSCRLISLGFLAFQSFYFYTHSRGLCWITASFSVGSFRQIQEHHWLKCTDMHSSGNSASSFIKCLLWCNKFAANDLEENWSTAHVNREQMEIYVQTAREKFVLKALEKSCHLQRQNKHQCKIMLCAGMKNKNLILFLTNWFFKKAYKCVLVFL